MASGKLVRRGEQPSSSQDLTELLDAQRESVDLRSRSSDRAEFLAFLRGASDGTLDHMRLAKLNMASNAWKVIMNQRDVMVEALNAMAEALADAKLAEMLRQFRRGRGSEFAQPKSKRS